MSARRHANGSDPAVTADRHGGKIREAAERLGVPPEQILDFSANVNFLGPLPPVMAAARRSLDHITWYPEETPQSLRRAAADFLHVGEERVLLGNGASELIFLAVADLRPRRVLVLGPTFTEYERAARAWGADVDNLFADPDAGFRLTPEALESDDFRRRLDVADLVFVCDPNNPTGALLEAAVKERLIDLAAEAGTRVFVDESFLAFTAAWPDGSAAARPDDHLLILHSFTKLLAVPGLRIGALVAPRRHAERLAGRLPPWNINCVAAEATRAGLEQTDLAERTIAATGQARRTLIRDLEGLDGVADVLPGDANFLCLRLDGVRAMDAAEATSARGVLVRDLSRFPGMGPEYLRVAVRSPSENERLLEAMGSALREAAAGRSAEVAG